MKPVYFNVDAKLPDGSDTNFILAVTIKKLGNKQIKIITDREGCLSDDSDDDSFDLENTTLTFIDNGTGFTFSRGEELKFVFYDADNNVVKYDKIAATKLRSYTIKVNRITGSDFYIDSATLTSLPTLTKVSFDGVKYVLSS